MRKTPKLVLATLCALALAAPVGTALGDPPRPAGGPNREAVKKAREERKDALEKKKDDLKEKRDDAKDERRERREDGGDKEHADHDGGVPDKLRDEWAKLRETRRERQRAHREEIKQKWGDLAVRAPVRAELKVHAWRMARLKRIRAVAVAEGKTAVVARVDKLIEKENQRDQKHMETLKAQGGDQ